MKIKSRKWLIREADRAFSVWIRNRDEKAFNGICPFCRKNRITDCFHFVTRAKYATRWDQRNAVGSCRGCNMRMEFDPHRFIQWFIRKHGVEAYDSLIADSNKISKHSNDALKDIIRIYCGTLT